VDAWDALYKAQDYEDALIRQRTTECNQQALMPDEDNVQMHMELENDNGSN
jgi:hypothetical protein